MPPLKPTHKKPTAGTAEQHGLDHPAVFIHLPLLECECRHPHGASTSAFSFFRDEASACRDGGEIYWIVSHGGLVAGFVYEFHFQWIIQGAETNNHYMWRNVFSASTSSYTQFLNVDTSVWNQYSPQREHFSMEVTLRDMHPGLTSEDALIGTRRLNSVVNTVRVRCTDLESGDRTKVPDQDTTCVLLNLMHFVGQVKLAEFDAPAIATPQSPASALAHGCAARGDPVSLEREPLWSMMYGLPDSIELITRTLTRSSVHEKGRTEIFPVSASIPSLKCVNAAFRWDNKGPVGLWIQLIEVAEGVQYRSKI
jgi:hypothetical protein